MLHSFKNRIGLAVPIGSTRNRSQIRSDYDKKQEMTKKPVNSKNRLVQPENRKNRQSNWLMPGWGFLTFPVKTMLFWSLKTNPKPNLITLSSQFITHASLCLTPHSPQALKSQLKLSLPHPSLSHLPLSGSLPHAQQHAGTHGGPQSWLGFFLFSFFLLGWSHRRPLSSAFC